MTCNLDRTVSSSRSSSVAMTSSMYEEFTVVLLAGGLGHRMYPLLWTSEQTKALLPLANRPMIGYSLEWLENEGFRHVLVVTRKNYENAIHTFLDQEFLLNARMNVEVIGLDDSDQEEETSSFGTAEALRKIRPRITAEHVMIVSSDVICDAPLQPLLNLHRVRNSALTALFFEPWKESLIQSNVVSKKQSDAGALESRVFLGVDYRNEARWLYVKHAADMDETLNIYLPILQK
jgi:NDP-sugar pyrophosphorylase family protein